MENNQKDDDFYYVAKLLIKNVNKVKRKTYEKRSNDDDKDKLKQIENEIERY